MSDISFPIGKEFAQDPRWSRSRTSTQVLLSAQLPSCLEYRRYSVSQLALLLLLALGAAEHNLPGVN